MLLPQHAVYQEDIWKQQQALDQPLEAKAERICQAQKQMKLGVLWKMKKKRYLVQPEKAWQKSLLVILYENPCV